jgi:hypothetical protein
LQIQRCGRRAPKPAYAEATAGKKKPAKISLRRQTSLGQGPSITKRQKFKGALAHHDFVVAAGRSGCVHRGMPIHVEDFGGFYDCLKRIDPVDDFYKGIHLGVKSVLPLTHGLGGKKQFA